jgi:hypothetical protein
MLALKEYLSFSPETKQQLFYQSQEIVERYITLDNVNQLILLSKQISFHYVNGPVIGLGESPTKIIAIQEMLDTDQIHQYLLLPISDLSSHQWVSIQIDDNNHKLPVPKGTYYCLKKSETYEGFENWKIDGIEMCYVPAEQLLKHYQEWGIDLLDSFNCKSVPNREQMNGLIELMKSLEVLPEQLINYPSFNLVDFAHTGASLLTYLKIIQTICQPDVFRQYVDKMNIIYYTYKGFDDDQHSFEQLINVIGYQITGHHRRLIHIVFMTPEMSLFAERIYNSETYGCRCLISYKMLDWKTVPSSIYHQQVVNHNWYKIYVYHHLKQIPT